MAGLNTTTGKPLIGSKQRRSKMAGSGRRKPKMSGKRKPRKPSGRRK
jgi:hypothetical protein